MSDERDGLHLTGHVRVPAGSPAPPAHWKIDATDVSEDEPPLTALTTRQVTAKAVDSAMRFAGLDQARLAKRMQSLGHSWHRQTVGAVISGSRKVPVDELLALSLALECSMGQLISPFDGGHVNHVVDVGSGNYLPAPEVAESAGVGRPSVLMRWDDDQPVFSGGIFRRLAAEVSADTGAKRRALAEEARAQREFSVYGPESQEGLAQLLARAYEGQIAAKGIELDDESRTALLEYMRRDAQEFYGELVPDILPTRSQKETR